jgi:hypothetical protein
LWVREFKSLPLHEYHLKAGAMSQKAGDYHGVVIRQSQKDARVFERMDIIGRKTIMMGLIVLYKVRVSPESLDGTIHKLQSNMADRFFMFTQNFYAHFYRDNELIAVFRYRVFRMTPDETTWTAAREYGKSLGIPEKQLDFRPCRMADETF